MPEPASAVPPPPQPSEQDSAGIARELTGDLPCARCGYNQRGLSILGACPECGLPVKATILALVDPKADELKQISHPRVVQLGLLIWTFGAFAACMCVWVLRASQVASDILNFAPFAGPAPWFAMACLVASGAGAAVLVHPHDGIRRRDMGKTLLGVACYFPLTAASWLIIFYIDPTHPSVYGNPTAIPLGRVLLRMVVGVSIIGVALLLRPGAVRLAQRSILVRSGRVDRQPMSALALAAGIAMAGDCIHFIMPYVAGGLSDLVYILGSALIAVGSFLLTVGLFSLTMDAWRVRQVIAAPGIGLVDIFDDKGAS